jgi:hypothetical protein
VRRGQIHDAADADRTAWRDVLGKERGQVLSNINKRQYSQLRFMVFLSNHLQDYFKVVVVVSTAKAQFVWEKRSPAMALGRLNVCAVIRSPTEVDEYIKQY